MSTYIPLVEESQTTTDFPCTSCGLCCKNLHNNHLADGLNLNRGDGICRYFDEQTNLCTIYEQRPLICQIEAYYQKYLKDIYSWQDFVHINLEVCDKLQKDSLKPKLEF